MASQVPVDIELTRQGDIAILTMLGTQNRINSIFLEKWMNALSEIEGWPGVKALVTTGSGKFYSNGLDLEYLTSLSKDAAKRFWRGFLELRRRILLYPMVTVAAINGHAFAGGMLIALLHDYRVMQTGRGWMCMNEIDIGLLFTPSLKAIMTTKFTPQMIRDISIYGNRFTADAALDIGLIDKVSDVGCALSAAVKFAESLVENRSLGREILSSMKEDFYGHIVFDDSADWLELHPSSRKKSNL